MARFYDPRSRTFRPICLEALIIVAMGPVIGAVIAVAMAVFP